MEAASPDGRGVWEHLSNPVLYRPASAIKRFNENMELVLTSGEVSLTKAELSADLSSTS